MNITLTENSYIFQSAKRLLETELDKCLDLLKENEEKWNEYMDLKLHDIRYSDCNCDFELNGATVHFNEEYLNDEFYNFCEIEYDEFIEWCKEFAHVDFNELRDNVGRTSSFYLGTLHNNCADKYIVALAEAVDEFNMSGLDFKMVGEKIRPILEWNDYTTIEDVVNEMLLLSEYLYNRLKNKLDKIVMVYDYINNVKDNQIDDFKEFVREEWIDNV